MDIKNRFPTGADFGDVHCHSLNILATGSGSWQSGPDRNREQLNDEVPVFSVRYHREQLNDEVPVLFLLVLF